MKPFQMREEEELAKVNGEVFHVFKEEKSETFDFKASKKTKNSNCRQIVKQIKNLNSLHISL